MTMTRRSALALPFAPLLAAPGKARIAITMDLEMSANFPSWDQTHWNYEKGNLDADTKYYARTAAARVREQGAHIHFFALGRVFEQEDIGWLEEIVRAGHPVGNHTYDHVYLLAQNRDQLQARFQRAPWLIEGKSIAQVIEENIRLTASATRKRLGIEPNGFRTPGGFADGLSGRPDLQRMLQSLGFGWISGRYVRHQVGTPGTPPAGAVFEDILRALDRSQPFRYPETGLIEIPMSPISDINAFRNGRWDLESFLRAIRGCVERTIETGGVFDFLGHPSCLVVTDPQMRVFDLICKLVRDAGSRAELVTLDRIGVPAIESRKIQ